MKKVFAVISAITMMAAVFAGGSKESKGGDLVIYSPNSDALVDAAYAFGEQYGINVEVLSMGTGECAERVVSEAGNPQADVWYGGVNYANGIKYAQYFEPHVAKDNKKLPEAYQNQGGCVTRYCLDGSAALLINKDVFRQLGIDPASFKGYNDLLNPKLKGHIAMGNPAASSSAWAELTNMLLVMGQKPYDEAAWAWVEKFAAQLNGTILSSSSAIYKGTVNGEYAVGVSYEDPCVGLLKDGATNVELVYPSEGAVWLPAGAAALKGAKNMHNAKLFLDWLVSDDGQKEIAKSTARPVNPNINNTTPVMLPFSKINVAYEYLGFCAENKTAWQERWTKIVQAAK
ncbi:MAG: extracellular solute-binding protein [Treponema sp.]|nr:extracellular solute-binding protein [Treponema sp.]